MRAWVQQTPTPVRLAPPASQLRASGSRWRSPPWRPRSAVVRCVYRSAFRRTNGPAQRLRSEIQWPPAEHRPNPSSGSAMSAQAGRGAPHTSFPCAYRKCRYSAFWTAPLTSQLLDPYQPNSRDLAGTRAVRANLARHGHPLERFARNRRTDGGRRSSNGRWKPRDACR